MKKASSIGLSKAPETESTDDNDQPKVCNFNYFTIDMFLFVLLIITARRKSKILFV